MQYHEYINSTTTVENTTATTTNIRINNKNDIKINQPGKIS